MSKLKVLELFGGIAACSKALERLGVDYEIADYVEIDKYAVKSFNAIHNTNFEPQDICEWNKDIEVDLIMHGSPCQDFSLAGKQAGGDEGSGTRSSLMYETIRIVNKLKPKYVIWENVKNLLSKKHRHNFDAYLETMEQLGYINYYQVLNAKDYGIPQNRERVFTVSILNKTNCSEELTKLLEMFENTDDEDILRKGKIKYEIFNKYGVDKKCFRCGNQLLISDLPEYKYLCFECDENMYEFEAMDFKFPEKKTLENFMIDYLENEVDDKYNVGEKRLEIIKNNLGNVFEDNFIIGSSQKNAFVGDGSICPTLTTAMANGGGQVPMIKYEFPPKQELKLKLKDLLEDEVDEKYYLSDEMIKFIKSNIPSDNDLSIPIKNANKKGYLEAYEGDGVDISSRMQYHRGNVQKESIQTITTSGGNDRGVVLKSKCKRLESLVEKTKFKEGKVLNMDLYNQTTNENISQCLTEPHHNSQRLFDGLRIRKLTPLETWRLMGFDDDDFKKAEAVNSNTQLYKQAGNSIVVNVLEAILRNLLFDNK